MTWCFWGSDKVRWKNNFFLKEKHPLYPDSYYLIDKIIEYAKIKNIELISLDQVRKTNKLDYIFCFDLPKFDNIFSKKILKDNKIKKILIINESKVIYSRNFQKNIYKYFYKIFTWADDLVDNKKFFKLYDGFDHNNLFIKNINKKYFSCMVNENKILNYDNSLYSKRLECIKWFEKKHNADFHLFGFNWDKRFIISRYKIIRLFNRINFLTKIFSYNFKCYKGTVKRSLKNKLSTLKNYKFSFVFENSSENGWITEKLFHCFFSLTVPIYIGAPNINKYIPKNCSINFYDFKNYDELYNYLKQIKKKEYLNYIKNIKIFLSSSKYKKFTSHYNLKILLKKIK
jgi:hypothetical protein